MDWPLYHSSRRCWPTPHPVCGRTRQRRHPQGIMQRQLTGFGGAGTGAARGCGHDRQVMLSAAGAGRLALHCLGKWRKWSWPAEVAVHPELMGGVQAERERGGSSTALGGMLPAIFNTTYRYQGPRRRKQSSHTAPSDELQHKR